MPDQDCDNEGLSKSDRLHLKSLEDKQQLVRDYTSSVAKGRTTGYYLYGTGGVGKSYSVMEELARLQVPYKLFNSRMTGRGLYDSLERFPDAIHVLEDMEQLFREGGARGVLRSALWSQGHSRGDGPDERLVTWTTCQMEHQFIFTGGIIMTANRPFPDVPEMHAVKTRITYMHLVVSDNEIIAMMRKIAALGHSRGGDSLAPSECREVCEYIIDECLGLNRQLDLRLFINSLSDYGQWRDCQSGCHWQDMVSTRVKERPTTIKEARSVTYRQDEKTRELELARELESVVDRDERRERWTAETGKSEQTLYRRLQQVRADELSDSQ